ncbi:hypothetical protein B0T17DRAFT_190821 [Bombardia bombarda]|uniref:Uncharacterized protein n=1 Tax=Bombardia bombarda TaxID=252184 RepID=A0AA40C9V7_9PEZI|nr:hypothetical protein B0T17DRAFT_190821 [Bombardia bombarda]
MGLRVRDLSGENLAFYIALPVLLIITLWAIESLTLAGCTATTPGLPGIFVVSLHSSDTASDTWVRMGYFGLCANDDEITECVPTGLSTYTNDKAVKYAMERLFRDSDNEIATDLVSTALHLQTTLFSGFLLLASCMIFSPGLFVVWLHWRYDRGTDDHKLKTAGQWRKYLSYGFLSVPSVLTFSAALSTLEATRVLKQASLEENSPILIDDSTTIVGLQFAACALTCLFGINVLWITRKTRDIGAGSNTAYGPGGGAGFVPGSGPGYDAKYDE